MSDGIYQIVRESTDRPASRTTRLVITAPSADEALTMLHLIEHGDMREAVAAAIEEIGTQDGTDE